MLWFFLTPGHGGDGRSWPLLWNSCFNSCSWLKTECTTIYSVWSAFCNHHGGRKLNIEISYFYRHLFLLFYEKVQNLFQRYMYCIFVTKPYRTCQKFINHYISLEAINFISDITVKLWLTHPEFCTLKRQGRKHNDIDLAWSLRSISKIIVVLVKELTFISFEGSKFELN